MTEPIKIEGLREFVRGLKRIDSDLPKTLKAGFKNAANLVVEDARPKVPVGPPAGGHAATSIRASSSANRIQVSEGNNGRFKYMPWLDFGGKVGINNSVSRPFIKKGRYIWASFADNQDQVQELLVEALNDTARAAGIDIE